jgi:hypothetical protein
MMRPTGLMGAGALLAAMQLTPALGQSTAGPFDRYWDAAVAGISEMSAATRQGPSARRKPANHNGDDKNGNGKNGDNDEGADTDNIFGFTEGSDVGDVGEKEFKIDSVLAVGRRDGSYLANVTAFQFSYVPFRNLEVAAAPLTTYHHISHVTGFDDRNRLAFAGLAVEAKYRVIERSPSLPIGLAAVVGAAWTRVEEATGERVTGYAAELKLVADAELMKDRLFAAFNALYVPERTRVHATGETEKESLLALTGGLSVQVAKGVFFGGEVHYLRAYEGLTLNDFVGDAVFVGPTMYAKLGEHCWIAATWTVQVAGQSVENPQLSLDLDHFSRHEGRVKLGWSFGTK